MGSNVSYIINTMAADELATQGARVSASIVLSYFSQNITSFIPEVGKPIVRSWALIQYKYYILPV